MSTAESESPDVVLIGASIMSATLGSVLKELEPALDVVMFETLQDCAQESSQAWNNAGTGHAANCELDVAKEDWGLAEYLIGQVLQTGSHQLKVLEQFYPEAQRQDWRKAVAGQRVQIIKPGPHHSGSLEFGTEVVGSTDNSIVALLGASPGASTAAYIAFETPEKCFAKERAGAGAEAELGSAEMLRELELLVMRGPPQLRFVLVTRHDLRLGLHRLRLAGELTEIRATDLQFTLDEARGLFDAAGVQLPGPALALLLERTEGWAAGLRLAALSLAGHPDPERFAAEFSGGERTVAEYLLAEVLERQPEQAVAMGVLVAKDSGA